MKRFLMAFIFTLFSTCVFSAQPEVGQLIRGMTPSGSTKAISVDADGKLQTSGGGGTGSVNNLASDTDGNLLVHINANSAVQVSSISVGIVLQDVRSIPNDSNINLADITSGTAAPFWLIIRNTGVNKIHVDSVAPGDTTDYIGSGEQYGPIYCGSNMLNEKFRANSNGTSTWALTIRK